MNLSNHATKPLCQAFNAAPSMERRQPTASVLIGVKVTEDERNNGGGAKIGKWRPSSFSKWNVVVVVVGGGGGGGIVVILFVVIDAVNVARGAQRNG